MKNIYIERNLFILSSTGGCVDQTEPFELLLKGFEIYRGATVLEPFGFVVG